MTSHMIRREFLQKSLAGAGLTLAFCLVGPGRIELANAEDDPKSEAWMPNAWLKIAPDNTITILVSRSEMGQGVFTSMPMIVAEELEADWKKVRVEASPVTKAYVDPQLGIQLTGGSMSVRNMFEPLRKAGATAREMLRLAAAKEWKVPVEECKALQGTVAHEKTGRKKTYGQLCQEAAKLPVPGNPPKKKAGEFNLIGKPVRRLDASIKINGTPIFGVDVYKPDMLYAVVARPPAYGAKLVSSDEEAAKKVPGVSKVVQIENGLAVCANSTVAAMKGREALNPKWDKGSIPDLDNKFLEKHYKEALEKKGIVTEQQGDAEKELGKSAKTISAEYSFPYVSHVPAEPPNCVVHVQKDRCDIWCPTQFQTGAFGAGVKITGLEPDQVHVHSTYLGGGFGRRTDVVEVIEAVQIAKAVGKPVKLLWTREDDIKYDFFRPASLHRMSAGVDTKGLVTSWVHKVATPSIAERAMPPMIVNNIDPTSVQGLGDQDYEIPNMKVEWVKVDLPIPVGFLRSVGHSSHAFVVECFLDELAHAAGKDPLAFRLDMLRKHPLPAGVLKTVAEKAGWGKKLPKGSGMGIAQHFSFGSHVGYVAQVKVDTKSGIIEVERVVCAVDCGSVVNPDTIKAQMEGATVMALSIALKEEVQFANGGVKSSNYDDYPLLTMSETPDIEVHVLKSDHPLGGIGEPGIPPLAPAVGNAVFAATGIRMRRLPMSPETVREAMARART